MGYRGVVFVVMLVWVVSKYTTCEALSNVKRQVGSCFPLV